MDPNVTLEELRELLQRAENARTNEEAAELYGDAVERFRALDDWLSRAGFLPERWSGATRGAL